MDTQLVFPGFENERPAVKLTSRAKEFFYTLRDVGEAESLSSFAFEHGFAYNRAWLYRATCEQAGLITVIRGAHSHKMRAAGGKA